LIQEAKAACRGSWYLPAGHVEQHEDLLLMLGFATLHQPTSNVAEDDINCYLILTFKYSQEDSRHGITPGCLVPFIKIKEAEMKHLKGLQLDDSHNLRLRAPIMRLISQASISQACASRLDLPPPSVLPAHPDSPLTGVFLRLLIEVRHQAPLSTTTTAAPLPPKAPLAANTGAHYVISTDTASRFPLIRVNHRTIKQTILRLLKVK
uniref:DUF3504 domain-containing protein n=1 Tax=Schistocephalus solidus TaxID=70667 RepID=A0A183TTX8_SCHSO